MHLRLAFVAAALASAAVPAAESLPPVDLAKGQQIASQTCAACHGPDGNSLAPANPKLASQTAEYLTKQLLNFVPAAPGKAAERQNAIMAGMAASLSPADMRNVAAFYASQVLKPDQAKHKETIELGQQIFRGGIAAKEVPACSGCHGPTGAGIPVQFPSLGGQYADYVEAQLRAFRSGERANDPNGMMRASAARLSDAEIKAVADYVAGLR